MSAETLNPAKTARAQIEAIEETVTDLLLDFTDRTGFVIDMITIQYSDPYQGKPRYYVSIKVNL